MLQQLEACLVMPPRQPANVPRLRPAVKAPMCTEVHLLQETHPVVPLLQFANLIWLLSLPALPRPALPCCPALLRSPKKAGWKARMKTSCVHPSSAWQYTVKAGVRRRSAGGAGQHWALCTRGRVGRDGGAESEQCVLRGRLTLRVLRNGMWMLVLGVEARSGVWAWRQAEPSATCCRQCPGCVRVCPCACEFVCLSPRDPLFVRWALRNGNNNTDGFPHDCLQACA